MIVLSPEFIHGDERRSLSQLLTADIKQINFYEAKKNAILGEHFHVETTEYFYLIEGQIIYNDLRQIDANTLFVVNPEEKHTLKCVTDIKLMTFLTKTYDHDNPDLFKEKR